MTPHKEAITPLHTNQITLLSYLLPMMNLNPFGRGDATNQSPTGDAGSPEMGRIERGRGKNAPSSSSPSFPSKSRRRGSAEADVYKARCSDLERNIIQLKLELAEAKVRVKLLSALRGGEQLVLGLKCPTNIYRIPKNDRTQTTIVRGYDGYSRLVIFLLCSQ